LVDVATDSSSGEREAVSVFKAEPRLSGGRAAFKNAARMRAALLAHIDFQVRLTAQGNNHGGVRRVGLERWQMS